MRKERKGGTFLSRLRTNKPCDDSHSLNALFILTSPVLSAICRWSICNGDTVHFWWQIAICASIAARYKNSKETFLQEIRSRRKNLTKLTSRECICASEFYICEVDLNIFNPTKMRSTSLFKSYYRHFLLVTYRRKIYPSLHYVILDICALCANINNRKILNTIKLSFFLSYSHKVYRKYEDSLKVSFFVIKDIDNAIKITSESE